jgi:tetratricopeptide (TPR) repeat protein
MKRSLLLLLALISGVLHGASADNENAWLKRFYKTDAVDQFDGFWKKVVAEKHLENKNTVGPILGFASQVLHRHPELLKGRFDDPKSLPEAQLEQTLTLLWLSDTPQAREILGRCGHADYAARTPPPIGSTHVKEAQDLDFCWGWFFATGDPAALDPIVAALDFGEYAGALKKYAASKKTDADKDAAFKDAIFGAAMWSLGANGKEDENITAHLEEILANPLTPKSRSIWLAVVLSQLKPDKYKVELTEGSKGQSATVKISTQRSSAAGANSERSAELDSLDATLARVAEHARDYPPKFASGTERKQIETELQKTIAALAAALGQHPDDPQLLFRDGFANALGHNLDFPGSAKRCMESYERLLELQPENGKACFYYGGFLASTAVHQKKGISYLERAIALGVTDAHYTLGFALLTQADKKGALEHFREYSRLNPTDKKVKTLIEQVETAEIKILKAGEKPPDRVSK